MARASGTTHVSVTMRCALDSIVHESAHVIQVRLRAGDQQIGDFFAFPGADTGLFVGRDVGDELAQGTNVPARTRHIHRPIWHADRASRRMTVATDRDVLRQVFATFDTALWRRG